MPTTPAIAVLGTFDSKAEEHIFLKERIEQRGFRTLTIHVGTGAASPFPAGLDLYRSTLQISAAGSKSRDEAIATMLLEAKRRIKQLYETGEICGVISAGGGTGTHLCSSIMHELPLGVPKVMVSTVASRDMRNIVGTKDIVMIHSVVDLLGVNSILGSILDRAAAGICGMVSSRWEPREKKPRIALPFFGFITRGAEAAKQALENLGYEVIAFHANGTGGTAMVQLAAEGYFEGILELATHELADKLKDGYCGGIGPERFAPVPGRSLPRLVVPGGLDCAVLEFTRDTVPDQYRNRKIFFYDFRSAIRLNSDETRLLADQLAEDLNRNVRNVKVLIPNRGWSEADRVDGPLYDPEINRAFVERLRQKLAPLIEIREVDHHINDQAFAQVAATMISEMIRRKSEP